MLRTKEASLGLGLKDQLGFIPFAEQGPKKKHTIDVTRLVGEPVTPFPAYDGVSCGDCGQLFREFKGRFSHNWRTPKNEVIQTFVRNAHQIDCGCKVWGSRLVGKEYGVFWEVDGLISDALNSQRPENVLEKLAQMLPHRDMEKVKDFVFNTADSGLPPYTPRPEPDIILPAQDYSVQ